MDSQNKILQFSINEKSNKIEFKDIDDKTAFMIALNDAEVPQEEAQKIVQGKIYQALLDKINIREENSDGRGIYEGELFFNGRKYEFEIAQLTGIIFDCNVDLRNKCSYLVKVDLWKNEKQAYCGRRICIFVRLICLQKKIYCIFYGVQFIW